MAIMVSKLKLETLQDIVRSVYGEETTCHKEHVHIVGGAPREEFTLVRSGKTISVVTNTEHKAWLYTADSILKGK